MDFTALFTMPISCASISRQPGADCFIQALTGAKGVSKEVDDDESHVEVRHPWDGRLLEEVRYASNHRWVRLLGNSYLKGCPILELTWKEPTKNTKTATN